MIRKALQATILCSILSCGVEEFSQLKIFGADSFPIGVTYNTYFQIDKKEFKHKLPLGIFDKTAFKKTDLELIEKRTHHHAMHVYGVFSEHEEPTNFYRTPGAITTNFKTTINKVDYDENLKAYVFTYSFYGEGVFHRALVENKGSPAKIRFNLPNDPVRIYTDIMKNTNVKDKDGHKINPCTSDYDNSDIAFYYYWSKTWSRHCRKDLFESLVHEVKAEFAILPETRQTYPEYHRLYANKTPEKPLRVDIIHGFDDDPEDENDLGRLVINFQLPSSCFSALAMRQVVLSCNLSVCTACDKICCQLATRKPLVCKVVRSFKAPSEVVQVSGIPNSRAKC